MSQKDKHKRPIVIKKVKKGGHGGHHGGSWKVAYADFVTAMMAFFMVMWILGMEQNLKEAIEGYFSNPVGYKKGYSTGQNILSSGNSPAQVKKPPIKMIVRAAEEQKFGQAEERLNAAVAAAKARLGNTMIEVTRTEQGLRIELMESGEEETFFARGSSVMKAPLVLALQLVASELTELSNPIVVEGHTDGAGFGNGDGDRTNWELSADRANAARRVLEASGISPLRISEVRGYADKRLRVPEDPLAPQNRRISLLLPFTQVPDPAPVVVDTTKVS
ncbi:MAG: OmpA family protein [Gemmatimonadaceae bacterium]|nr:OmpA family protein [Gemmatimonadaceae bacterium]